MHCMNVFGKYKEFCQHFDGARYSAEGSAISMALRCCFRRGYDFALMRSMEICDKTCWHAAKTSGL